MTIRGTPEDGNDTRPGRLLGIGETVSGNRQLKPADAIDHENTRRGARTFTPPIQDLD
jgi:hypothetical protein